MSDWLVHLVRIGKIRKHPNADALDMTEIYGQNIITKRDLYREGDLAVFLPPDSVLSLDPQNIIVKDSGLAPGHCIEAKRLRGIFSNGMLIPADVCFTRSELGELRVGEFVADKLDITKYESPADKLQTQGENERDPGYLPTYTDIEGWPKFRNENIIKENDDVVLTEKIHGANARFAYRDGRLWVGSHHGIKKQNVFTTPEGKQIEKNLWWSVAKAINLEEKFVNLLNGNFDLGSIEDGNIGRVKKKLIAQTVNPLDGLDLSKTVLYGEVYGQVQDLKYGITSGAALRIFDSFDGTRGQYNDWRITVAIVTAMGLDLVPELYCGPWKQELEEMRNGKSVLYPGNIREGYVMKPLTERFDEYIGRVIFKHVGEDYKLRKRKQS